MSYKLNTDVAFHDNGTGAVGVVLRNSIGEAIVGVASPLSHVLDAAITEALAPRKGIDLLEYLGCSNVTTESDSPEIPKLCRGEMEVIGPYAVILSDCFTQAQMIDGVSF